MLLLLALIATAQQSDEDALRARVAAQPPAVRDLIERRAACIHWGGEPDEHPVRRRQIRREMRALRCDGIDRQEAALRRRYARQPDVLAILTETSSLSAW